MADSGTPSWHTYVEGIGKAAALGVILLPVAGAVLRLIAFSTGNVAVSPLLLAWSAPISQLVATALSALRSTALLLLLFALSIVGLRLYARLMGSELWKWPHWFKWPISEELRRELAQPEWFRIPSPWVVPARILLGLIAILLGLAVVWLLASMPDWPYALVALPGAVIITAIAALVSRPGDRARLRQTWPAVVAAVIFPAIAQGIGGGLVGTPVGHYSFKSELAGVVSDGDFQELGQSGNDLILASCDSPTRSVVRVPEGEIGAGVHQYAVGQRRFEVADQVEG